MTVSGDANVMEILKDLAAPRAVGTPGEQRAQARIRACLEAAGWEVHEQPFSASWTPLRVLLPSVAVLLGVLSLAGGWLYGPNPPAATLAAAAGLCVLVLLAVWGWRMAESLFDWGAQLWTCNLLATRKGQRPPPGESGLVLMAHYDSKSQTLPMLIRGFAWVVGVASLAVLFLLSLAAIGGKQMAWPQAALALGIVGGVAFLMQLLNRPGNRSPGALDNASGVAILLAMAHRLGDSAAAGNITLVFTGAEEVGLAGSLRFIQSHDGSADLGGAPMRTLRVINVDSVGSARGICVVGKDRDLRRRIAKSAAAVGIPVKPLRLAITVGLDHMPIARRGYAAVSIVGKLSLTALRAIHSSGDRPAGVDATALARLADLLQAVVEDFDE